MAKRRNFYLGLGIALILSILLLHQFSFKEGMTNSAMGMYDYLAPSSDRKPYTWSDDVIDQFTSKINSIPGATPQLTTDQVKAIFLPYTTETEAKYYIQNGQWPMNQYIMNFIDPHTNLVKLAIEAGKMQKTVLGNDLTNETVPKYLSVRLIFQMLLLENEAKVATLAFQIFNGTAPAPISPGATLLGGDKKRENEKEKEKEKGKENDKPTTEIEKKGFFK